MGKIDWRNTKSLSELNASEALQVLGMISEALKHSEPQQTMDATDPRVLAINDSAEAIAFADACNALGRKMRAVHDCRPQLRQAADAKRETRQRTSPEEDASDYASSCKAYHRK